MTSTSTSRTDTDRPAAEAASIRLQAATKAINAAASTYMPLRASHLRQLAQEKQASAEHLLRQYEQRCSANPQTSLSAPVVALWEGYYALRAIAKELTRKAEETEAKEHAASAVHTHTHRATTTHAAHHTKGT
ncbi:hypothetical protein [Paracidovorax wautersii]|uniref:Uncharacterized protein n=1 Tax=Paracidovorax wautersii TaxID=1177982 RepID=A0A1I2E6R5_9BURK|nr:hypothetical protein [Paracidovorax wautersii]SFE88326.1 hypothetical protein SAMN04489711_106253 [Paracidovorax wautersii]